MVRMGYGRMDIRCLVAVCSSVRWRRGWRASLKSLVANHSPKAVVPVLCLGAVIYGLADKLRNFVVGVFTTQYHYPYAVALSFAQALISLLVMNLLHVVGLVPLRGYSGPLGERLLVPAVCNSAHAVLSTWAKASGWFAGLLPLTLPLLPLLTAGFGFALKLSSPPSVHICVLTSIVGGTSTVIKASRGLPGAEPLEYFYAPLAVILHSVALAWLAKVSETEQSHCPDAPASAFHIYYTQLVNQSWVLGLLWLLHVDNPWHVLSQGSWHSLFFHGYLLAALLLGMLLNLLLCMAALRVSPFTAALIHSASEVAQPFLQLL